MDFGLLGPLSIRRSGGTVALPSAKQRSVLAVLLLEASHAVVPAERLIDELWGEEPPATAAKALQVLVSKVRKTLGPGQPIVTRPTGYAIELDGHNLDVLRFDSLLGQARRLRSVGDPQGALSALDEALALWRGAALADVTLLGPSAIEANRLEGRRAVAVEDRLELQLERGDSAAFVPELEALVATHPYRERGYGLLMLALYRAGRQADALDVFRRARSTLVEDLGIEPGPELAKLEASILAQDAALAREPEGSAASDARPRAVPAQGPGAASSAPTILGREAELDLALTLLGRPEVRLVTLTGTGGIGKTRLAAELAQRLSTRTHLVELAAITDPRRVVAAIASALDARAASEDEIAAVIATSPLVLVLDNFEQVLEAAPLVSSLLGRADQLKVVVTSRAPLQVAGERELPVPPLELDPAVELFLRRVREREPSYSPDEHELGEIAAICDRLDGLPLAIELAAARTRVLAPRAILERVGRRLDLLTAGRRDAPVRHRTLRATIAWSYDLLAEDEQRLFAQLAVFHSGWVLEASEAVAGGDVLDSLSALVDHSLVIREDDRFTMLETVREYAAEQFANLPNPGYVCRQHARWCAALAEQAEAELEGPDQTTWFGRLDDDQENLRAACAWSKEAGESEFALMIGGALWRYWLARGGAGEIGDLLRAALASGDGDQALRAKALNAAGVLSGATDEFETARACFEEALEVATASQERRQMARALGNLGTLAWFGADYDGAREWYTDAAAIWHELGDVQGQSVMLQNLALVHQAVGNQEQALRMLEESVDLARTTGDRVTIAARLAALARVLVFERPVDPRIAALLAEALDLLAAVGERLQTAECLELVAQYSLASEEAETAALLIGAADAERAKAGGDRKPDELPFFTQTIKGLEETLGQPAFEHARARGRERELEQAVAFALDRLRREQELEFLDLARDGVQAANQT